MVIILEGLFAIAIAITLFVAYLVLTSKNMPDSYIDDEGNEHFYD